MQKWIYVIREFEISSLYKIFLNCTDIFTKGQSAVFNTNVWAQKLINWNCYCFFDLKSVQVR